MTTVNVYDAKSQFSRLVAAAEAGETVVIARNGKPVAQLGPVSTRPDLVFGDLEGRIRISEDFDQWGEADERMWFGDDSALS